MNQYFIITVGDNYNAYCIIRLEEGAYYDKGPLSDCYEAPTRAKAKARFFKDNDLEFTTPVRTRKLIDCEWCGNDGYVNGQIDQETGYPEMVDCPECKGHCLSDDPIPWEESNENKT